MPKRSLEEIIDSNPRFSNVDVNKAKAYYEDAIRQQNAKILPEITVTSTGRKRKSGPKQYIEGLKRLENIIAKNDRDIANLTESNMRHRRKVQEADKTVNDRTFTGDNVFKEFVAPVLHFTSPSQQFGAIVDAIQGEVPYWKGIKNGNSGFVTDDFYNEHPYYSTAINILADGGIYGLPKVYNVSRAHAVNKKYNKLLNNDAYPNLKYSDIGDLTNDAIYRLADRMTFNLNPMKNNGKLGQYLRYYIGKAGKYKDAELPNFYRKIKYDLYGDNPTILTTKDGKIAISSPQHRFVHKGKPVAWTNLTADNPVMPHKSSWDGGYTLIGNTKDLLGKRVLSLTPGDIVINGDIALPASKLKAISGNSKYIKALKDRNVKVIEDNKVKEAFSNAINDLKPNFTDYGKVTRKQLRQYVNSPTLKDLEFADYVFNPIIRSNVHPVLDFKKMTITNKDHTYDWVNNISDRISSKASLQLLDKDNWKNIQYYPSPSSDDRIRNILGVEVLPADDYTYKTFIPINKNYVVR